MNAGVRYVGAGSRTGRVTTGVLVAHTRNGRTTFRCWMNSPAKPDQVVSIYTDGTSIY